MWAIAFFCCPAEGFAQQEEAVVDYYKKPDDSKIPTVFSRQNYKSLTAHITSGCNSKYEKIRAIYQWICEHIAYDTSYKVRNPDECLRKQKGVCQAYCGLFYLLAKEAGIRVEALDGKPKDQTGYVNPSGHGWLFAYTQEERGILLDPTWGAGSVEDGQFVTSENIWVWFNVAPEWMILSHLPDDATCQLLEKPVTEQEFLAFPPANTVWLEYGLDARKLFEKIRAQRTGLPQFYNGGEGIIELVDIPLSPSLKIGTTYTFRVKLKEDRNIAIMNSNVLCPKGEWTDEGDGIYSIEFMPRETESLSICMQDASGVSWSTLVNYEIATPTQEEWNMVGKLYPMSTPEMKAVKNMDAKEWADAGIDNLKLAGLVREQGIRELPIMQSGMGQKLAIESVPMHREMKKGESYTFSFYPKTEGKWVVANGEEWFRDWQVAEDGRHSITVSPTTSGRLSLLVQDADGGYWPCLEYMVP